MADLHQKFSALAKLQNLCVTLAITTDPDIAFVIDGNAMVGDRPLVAFSFTAPVANEVAPLIELQNGWSRETARGGRWICQRVSFLLRKRFGPMNDPDVVLSINRDANGRTDAPMVRQWLRPQRVHLKHWRLHAGGFGYRPFFE